MGSTARIPSESFFQSILLFFQDIKIKHTVFALPFAAVSLAFLDLNITPSWSQIIALLVCMISARSWAMGANRLFDREIDSRNPRTEKRLIASGRLSTKHAKLILSLFAMVFVVSSFYLNVQAGWLSIPLLLILAFYSLTKRFTWLCHYYLGFCLGLAPVAVSVALTSTVPIAVVLVGLAITFWTAGFDILYSMQDWQKDRSERLNSIPSRYGLRAARLISRLNFFVTIILLIAAGIIVKAGFVYYAGIAIIAGLLAYQHLLIGLDTKKPVNFKNMGAAFFDSNALVSIFYCMFTFADIFFMNG